MSKAKLLRLESVLDGAIWTHKILEKQAEIYSARDEIFKAISIVLVAFTGSGAITAALANFDWVTIPTAIAAAASLAVTIWREASDYAKKTCSCSSAAVEFLSLRDHAAALAFEIFESDDKASVSDIDTLENRYISLCKLAPRTSKHAVSLADKGLRGGESKQAQEALIALKKLDTKGAEIG